MAKPSRLPLLGRIDIPVRETSGLALRRHAGQFVPELTGGAIERPRGQDIPDGAHGKSACSGPVAGSSSRIHQGICSRKTREYSEVAKKSRWARLMSWRKPMAP